jgi:hypothetical protein
MYFFDYGNAFLLEAGRAGADVVPDICHRANARTVGWQAPPLEGLGRLFFVTHLMCKISWDQCVLIMVLALSAGFAPSANPKDLEITDKIATASS